MRYTQDRRLRKAFSIPLSLRSFESEDFTRTKVEIVKLLHLRQRESNWKAIISSSSLSESCMEHVCGFLFWNWDVSHQIYPENPKSFNYESRYRLSQSLALSTDSIFHILAAWQMSIRFIDHIPLDASGWSSLLDRRPPFTQQMIEHIIVQKFQYTGVVAKCFSLAPQLSLTFSTIPFCFILSFAKYIFDFKDEAVSSLFLSQMHRFLVSEEFDSWKAILQSPKNGLSIIFHRCICRLHYFLEGIDVSSKMRHSILVSKKWELLQPLLQERLFQGFGKNESTQEELLADIDLWYKTLQKQRRASKYTITELCQKLKALDAGWDDALSILISDASYLRNKECRNTFKAMSEFLGRLDFVYYVSGFCFSCSPEEHSIMPEIREILLLSAEQLPSGKQDLLASWWFAKKTSGHDICNFLRFLGEANWKKRISVLSNQILDSDLEMTRKCFRLALQAPHDVIEHLLMDAIHKKKMWEPVCRILNTWASICCFKEDGGETTVLEQFLVRSLRMLNNSSDVSNLENIIIFFLEQNRLDLKTFLPSAFKIIEDSMDRDLTALGLRCIESIFRHCIISKNERLLIWTFVLHVSDSTLVDLCIETIARGISRGHDIDWCNLETDTVLWQFRFFSSLFHCKSTHIEALVLTHLPKDDLRFWLEACSLDEQISRSLVEFVVERFMKDTDPGLQLRLQIQQIAPNLSQTQLHCLCNHMLPLILSRLDDSNVCPFTTSCGILLKVARLTTDMSTTLLTRLVRVINSLLPKIQPDSENLCFLFISCCYTLSTLNLKGVNARPCLQCAVDLAFRLASEWKDSHHNMNLKNFIELETSQLTAKQCKIIKKKIAHVEIRTKPYFTNPNETINDK